MAILARRGCEVGASVRGPSAQVIRTPARMSRSRAPVRWTSSCRRR